MINFIVYILSVPPLRYPEKWKPALLESYGSPDCIHMSKNTFDLVNYKDSNIERKTIQIRGKGLMDTILVHT